MFSWVLVLQQRVSFNLLLNCALTKLVMELHHGSAKEREASVGASPYGLSHPYEPVIGRLHK